jgi:hypothetical protein
LKFATLDEAKLEVESRITPPIIFEDQILDHERAERMRNALSEFYEERVCTVSMHCGALYQWLDVVQKSGYAANDLAYSLGLPEEWSIESKRHYASAAMGRMVLMLRKSDLAYRLVYLGEKVRTEKCPGCKGRWGRPHGSRSEHELCVCDGTGWIPPKQPPIETDCEYCGDLAWTLEEWPLTAKSQNEAVHKRLCPYRTSPWCQPSEPASGTA